MDNEKNFTIWSVQRAQPELYTCNNINVCNMHLKLYYYFVAILYILGFAMENTCQKSYQFRIFMVIFNILVLGGI